jgi:hypothetical protein
VNNLSKATVAIGGRGDWHRGERHSDFCAGLSGSL